MFLAIIICSVSAKNIDAIVFLVIKIEESSGILEKDKYIGNMIHTSQLDKRVHVSSEGEFFFYVLTQEGE